MDGENRDPDTGQYTARFADEELLEAIAEHEPVGTTAIADKFGCSQPGAYKRLKSLEDAGSVQSKIIGGNRVWMTV